MTADLFPPAPRAPYSRTFVRVIRGRHKNRSGFIWGDLRERLEGIPKGITTGLFYYDGPTWSMVYLPLINLEEIGGEIREENNDRDRYYD